ncbi:MAG: hypothetical protein FWC38_06320 [Proteobacteria bacterium]|nr:hypothetical protein [Pseudomonadota bacterium]
MVHYSGGRNQKSEVRSQKSEVRSQKSEVRGQRSEVRGQRSEVRGQVAPDTPSPACGGRLGWGCQGSEVRD